MDPPRSTTGASPEDLLELVQSLRHALAARREAPAGPWVEEVAADLRSGRRIGWCYPPSAGGGLAFFAARGSNAFGHVHVEVGPEDEGRAFALASTLLDRLPEDLLDIDVGFTGLDRETERRLLGRLGQRPGSSLIERQAIERPIDVADALPLGPIPAGLLQVPLTDVTVDALAELDRQAFSGTVDELLVGRTFEDHRRVMEALLSGRLGMFLPDASSALLAPEGPRLVGVLLTAEASPQEAVFLSFMVHPADRGRGHGRYLLRWGLRSLRALGYSKVHLWVTMGNLAARSLYESVGFRPFAYATIYRWERPGSPPQPHSER